MGMIPEARAVLADVRAQGSLPAAVENAIHSVEAAAHLYELKPAAALQDLRPVSIDPILAGLALIEINRAADGIKSCESARTQWDRPAIQANIELCEAEGLIALHRPAEAVVHLTRIDASLQSDPMVAWRMAVLAVRMNGKQNADQMRHAISALKDLWGDSITRRLLRPDVQRDLKLRAWRSRYSERTSPGDLFSRRERSTSHSLRRSNNAHRKKSKAHQENSDHRGRPRKRWLGSDSPIIITDGSCQIISINDDFHPTPALELRFRHPKE